ncbi:MAG TPA: hypothetical protein VGX50_13445 [Longimicrobium sp.]|nr:hypothetical protein [Longimicrobium sp.]
MPVGISRGEEALFTPRCACGSYSSSITSSSTANSSRRVATASARGR